MGKNILSRFDRREKRLQCQYLGIPAAPYQTQRWHFSTIPTQQTGRCRLLLGRQGSLLAASDGLRRMERGKQDGNKNGISERNDTASSRISYAKKVGRDARTWSQQMGNVRHGLLCQESEAFRFHLEHFSSIDFNS